MIHYLSLLYKYKMIGTSTFQIFNKDYTEYMIPKHS